MPTVRAFTNVSKSALPKDFMVNFIDALGKSLNREPKVSTVESAQAKLPGIVGVRAA